MNDESKPSLAVNSAQYLKNKDHIDELKSRLLDVRYSMWNALLTIHGFIIGLLSISGINHPQTKYFVVAIVISSTLSCGLLIWNMIKMETFYESLIRTLLKVKSETSFAERINKSQSIALWMFIRTLITQILLLVESIVILYLVFIAT